DLKVLGPDQAGGVSLPRGSSNWLKWAFRSLRHQTSLETFIPLSVLPEFIRSIAQGDRLPSDATHPDPIVTQVIRLLEQADTPSLDALSKSVGLTTFHLQRRFRTAVGVTPLQYANAWKLDSIADELRRTHSLPLVELAAEYGFNDMKHF